MAADTMSLVADDVQTLVIPGVGHWLAEQAPEELLVALIKFLAPSRGGTPDGDQSWADALVEAYITE
jgi:hypothetical protein